MTKKRRTPCRNAKKKCCKKNRKISQKPLINKVGGVHFYLHTSTRRVGENLRLGTFNHGAIDDGGDVCYSNNERR